MDPLIEHPPLLILLDLVLLKPRVYLHLLFNRGHPPKDGRPASQKGVSDPDHAIPGIWLDWSRVFMLTIVAETVSRLVTRSLTSGLSEVGPLVTVATVAAELIAQHSVTTMVALAALKMRGWWRSKDVDGVVDGRQKHFK
jgi:hypothetical protein